MTLRDREARLHYYRARYYDPKIGRFISEDPIPVGIRSIRELNGYPYVANNPPNWKDPFGLESGAEYRWQWCVGTGRCQPPPVPPDPAGNLFDACEGAERANFPGFADPYGGGFRHCMCACLLKRRYGMGGNVAVFLWDKAFEDPNDANSRGDMDAEQKGLQCAAGGGTCEDECLKKYPRFD
jgi:RHS repeat-associated protein